MTLNGFEVPPPPTYPTMLQPAKELSEFHTDYFMYVDEFKIIDKFAKQEGNLLELKREWALD